MDRLLARRAWDGQITRVPETPGRPDDLDATVPGAFGAHGRFDDRAQETALAALNPQHAWWGVGALAAAAAALLLRPKRSAPRLR